MNDKERERNCADWVCTLLTPGTEVHSTVVEAAKTDGKRLHDEQAAAAVVVMAEMLGLEQCDETFDAMQADLEQLFHPGMRATMKRRIADGTFGDEDLTVPQVLAKAAVEMRSRWE